MIRIQAMLIAATSQALLESGAQSAFVADLQNFLSRVARGIVRLTHGHETLLIVILIMLVLIYLYLRKA